MRQERDTAMLDEADRVGSKPSSDPRTGEIAFYEFLEYFDVVGELYTNYGLESYRTNNTGAAREKMKPSAEAIGAIKLYLARNSFFEVGAGWKVANGYGSATPRRASTTRSSSPWKKITGAESRSAYEIGDRSRYKSARSGYGPISESR